MKCSFATSNAHHRALITSYFAGETIQVRIGEDWFPIGDHGQGIDLIDYPDKDLRIAPKVEFMPWTFDTYPRIPGMWIRHQDTTVKFLGAVTAIEENGLRVGGVLMTWSELRSGCEWSLDISANTWRPCGENKK